MRANVTAGAREEYGASGAAGEPAGGKRYRPQIFDRQMGGRESSRYHLCCDGTGMARVWRMYGT